jgi:hypothetical protein
LRDYSGNGERSKEKGCQENNYSEKSVTKYAIRKAHKTSSSGWEAVPLALIITLVNKEARLERYWGTACTSPYY